MIVYGTDQKYLSLSDKIINKIIKKIFKQTTVLIFSSLSFFCKFIIVKVTTRKKFVKQLTCLFNTQKLFFISRFSSLHVSIYFGADAFDMLQLLGRNLKDFNVFNSSHACL
jgi:hypothetical protein